MSRFNLSALAVRERSITLFLIVAIILSGTYAFLRLGRAEDPSFVIKTLTVTAVWPGADRKSTRLNSSHSQISYAVFCLKKQNYTNQLSPIRKRTSDKWGMRNRAKTAHECFALMATPV